MVASTVDGAGNRLANGRPVDPRAPDGGTGPGHSLPNGPQAGMPATNQHRITVTISEAAHELVETCDHTIESVEFTIGKTERIVGRFAFKTGHFINGEVIKNVSNNLRGIVKSAAARRIFDQVVRLEEHVSFIKKRFFLVNAIDALNQKREDIAELWNSGTTLDQKVARSAMIVDVALLKLIASETQFGLDVGMKGVAIASQTAGSWTGLHGLENFGTQVNDANRKIDDFVKTKIDGTYIANSIDQAVMDFMLADIHPYGMSSGGLPNRR